MKQLTIFKTHLLDELEKGVIRCGSCKEEKPVEEFGSNRSKKNGKAEYCRVCVSARDKKYSMSPEGKAKRKARKRAYDATEKGKAAKKVRAMRWEAKHPGRNYQYHYQYQREKILQRRFNLTEAEYNAMLTNQNGVCAICKRPESRKRKDGSFYYLAVDHDHLTGEVRGLLCRQCNTTLSYFENTEFFNSALAYLGLGIASTQTTEQAM